MPGEFRLYIKGVPRTADGYEKLMKVLEPRIQKFSSDYKVDIPRFMQWRERSTVEGVPENMAYLDNLMKSVFLYIPRYLSGWSVKIEVKYQESG